MAYPKRLLSDRVLVLPDIAIGKTASGIFIPETAKEKPKRGKVVMVGEGNGREEMVLEIGDYVVYGSYAGTEVEFDGTTYLIMREADVHLVLEPIN